MGNNILRRRNKSGIYPFLKVIKLKREKIIQILDTLDKEYGTIPCYLEHETDWQLLIATILSAQCTDDRVNMITKDLFQKYKTLEDVAAADIKEFEKDIHSAGFYRNKAKNILACANKLISDFDGKVPSGIDELTSLAGVGRKTANVIRGNIYNIPSIVVDTHVKRISYLLGITATKDPVKAEKELMECIPEDYWIRINTQLIAHGRKVCISGRPKCSICVLNEFCENKKVEEKKK